MTELESLGPLFEAARMNVASVPARTGDAVASVFVMAMAAVVATATVSVLSLLPRFGSGVALETEAVLKSVVGPTDAGTLVATGIAAAVAPFARPAANVQVSSRVGPS